MENKTPQVSLELPPKETESDCFKQLTIIGRGSCGKTSIINRYIENQFYEKIEATPMESSNLEFEVKKKKLQLKIWDTSGQDDYSRFRSLTIPISDYVIIVYSVIDALSYYEVEDTLYPMVKQKGRVDGKVILVATKIDLRTDGGVTYEEGLLLSKRIGAYNFFECSSLTNKGITEIFKFLQEDMYKSIPGSEKGFFSKLFCC